jgi:hypothetical protein
MSEGRSIIIEEGGRVNSTDDCWIGETANSVCGFRV